MFQTHEANAEEAQRLVAILKHVVVMLNKPTLSDVLVDVKDVHQRSWQFGLASRRRWQFSGNRETVQPIGAEYIKDQHTLLRNHGAARLTDDGWMLYALFIAHGHDLVDHVGRVLLQRVVHGELKAGLAAVVIDAQPAANIDVLHSRAGLGQLRIDAREFIDPLIHLTNVMNLAAHVAMQELQAIFHSLGTEDREHFQDLSHAETKLRLQPARVAPTTGTLRSQIDAHADGWTNAVLLIEPQDQLEFSDVLNHRNDVAPKLLGERSELNVSLFLEAIANDQPLRSIAGHPHDR